MLCFICRNKNSNSVNRHLQHGQWSDHSSYPALAGAKGSGVARVASLGGVSKKGCGQGAKKGVDPEDQQGS